MNKGINRYLKDRFLQKGHRLESIQDIFLNLWKAKNLAVTVATKARITD